MLILDLLLSVGQALCMLGCLVDNLAVERRIGPDYHAEHPLDVRQAEIRESAGLLSLLLQRFHQELEGLDGVPVPLSSFRDSVRFTTRHLQESAVRLDLLCEVLLTDHGADVWEVVDLLDYMIELLASGCLLGDLLEVEDVIRLLRLLLLLGLLVRLLLLLVH